MSIATELTALSTNLDAAYTAIGTKGGTVPANKNTDHLASAISSVPSGQAKHYADITLSDDTVLSITSFDDFMSLCAPTNASGVPATSWQWQHGNDTYTNQQIKSATVYDDATFIPENFLAGSYVTSVTFAHTGLVRFGSNVLRGCSKLTSLSNIPASSIGQYFLGSCTTFNAPVNISASCTNIETYFMFGCTKFNQNITLPAALTGLGAYALYNCHAMVSQVDVGSLAFTVPTSGNYTFATTVNTAACYTTGITIVGSTAADWLSRFPNRTTSPYRKLINGNAS